MAHDVTNFQAQVIERSRTVPVLVDFWVPWCGPYVQFASVLEAIAGEADDKWELAKVNTEEAGKAVFRLLGLRHPAVEKHNRAFTSPLHS